MYRYILSKFNQASLLTTKLFCVAIAKSLDSYLRMRYREYSHESLYLQEIRVSLKIFMVGIFRHRFYYQLLPLFAYYYSLDFILRKLH